MTFWHDNPEAWRVSFRCLLDRRRLAGDRRRKRKHLAGESAGGPSTLKLERRDRWHRARWKRVKLTSAWPLAERAEAMLRAFNNPEAYARRLARHLHAPPHRGQELLRCESTFEPLIAPADFTALREHTGLARRCLESG